MRHGRKKEREKRRRTDATIVKNKRDGKIVEPVEKNKGSNRPQRVPFEKKVHQCSHQWTGAPMDGQGAPVKKKAGIRWKEPASRRTPASQERCEREKGQKKEDSVVCEVRRRQNKVSEDMSDSYMC
jgi:flagellar biosynthesis/type III secretory pathway ATPase